MNIEFLPEANEEFREAVLYYEQEAPFALFNSFYYKNPCRHPFSAYGTGRCVKGIKHK